MVLLRLGGEVGQKEKLIRKLRSRPRDFTFDEAETLLGYLGFKRSNKGATSGSRVKFEREGGATLLIHMLHPGKTLHAYQVKELANMPEREGLI